MPEGLRWRRLTLVSMRRRDKVVTGKFEDAGKI